MIKQGVLPLNIIIGMFYLVAIGLALLAFKYANKPLKRFRQKQKQKQDPSKQQDNTIDFNKITALSILKKYTLPGACFCLDKKYLLKQFLFIGAYGVACLNINQVILWPVALSICLFTISFLLCDVMLKKVQQKLRESSQNKINVQEKRGESEAEIQSSNVQARIQVVRVDSIKEHAKINTKEQRNIVEMLTVSAICITSIVMMLQVLMTLGNSVSNSGELNIISLLSAIAMDQFAVRIGMCGVMWTVCKVMREIRKRQGEEVGESPFVAMVCHEELVQIWIQEEKERMRKQLQMVNSPPRKKVNSPSRVPKALLSAQRQTYLNLINLQPTSRQGQEVIDQIYLTTAQKDLFQPQNNIDNKSGFYTKRHKNRQNRQILSFSANRGTTIDVDDKRDHNDDLVILHENPFKQIENLPCDEFFLDSSGVKRTRRKGYKKRNKRNLKLTGNSPYLEYLPDMLKKVDQFKNINTSKNTTIQNPKKIL